YHLLNTRQEGITTNESTAHADIDRQPKTLEVIGHRRPVKPGDLHVSEAVKRKVRLKNIRIISPAYIDILLPGGRRRTRSAVYMIHLLDLPRDRCQPVHPSVRLQDLAIPEMHLLPRTTTYPGPQPSREILSQIDHIYLGLRFADSRHPNGSRHTN